MTQPITGFLVDSDDSELDLPELKDDSDFGNLAKYVRRRPNGRPDNLFLAAAAATAGGQPANMFAHVRLKRKTMLPVPEPVAQVVEPVRQPLVARNELATRLKSPEARRAASPALPLGNLEQTLNVTHFDLHLPQCHSTPHPGPGKPQRMVAVTAAAEPQAQAPQALPSNISININLHDPAATQSQSNAVAATPAAAAQQPPPPPSPTDAVLRRLSQLPRPSVSTIVEAAASPHRTLVAIPVAAPPMTPQRRQPPRGEHVTTPRPAASSAARSRFATPESTPRTLALAQSPLSMSSKRDREALREKLREKCAAQEAAAAAEAATRLNAAAAARAAAQRSAAATAPAKPLAANTSAEAMPPPPLPVDRPISASAPPPPPDPKDQPAETLYDIEAYLRNVRETDIIHDNSPTTSQTLQNNLLQLRERSTFGQSGSQSLRQLLGGNRTTRGSRQQRANEAAEEIEQLAETLRGTVQTWSGRPLYSKGDSLLGGSNSAGSTDVEQQQQQQAKRRSSKRRSGEMLAKEAEAAAAEAEAKAAEPEQQQQRPSQLRRAAIERLASKAAALMSNSKRPDDRDLLTSDEDGEPLAKAAKKPPPLKRQKVAVVEEDEDEDEDGGSDFSENDILDSFREQSFREPADTQKAAASANAIHNDWQTEDEDGAGRVEQPNADKQARLVRSRIPQPKARAAAAAAPKKAVVQIATAASAADRRGTFTVVAQVAEKQDADRRGTYTKAKSVRDEAESEEDEESYATAADDVDQRPQATYTKSVLDDEERSQKRGTYTKSRRGDDAASATEEESDDHSPTEQRKSKRGTYTKSQAERHSDERPTKRGTYTKESNGVDSDVEMAEELRGQQKRHAYKKLQQPRIEDVSDDEDGRDAPRARLQPTMKTNHQAHKPTKHQRAADVSDDDAEMAEEAAVRTKDQKNRDAAHKKSKQQRSDAVLDDEDEQLVRRKPTKKTTRQADADEETETKQQTRQPNTIKPSKYHRSDDVSEDETKSKRVKKSTRLADVDGDDEPASRRQQSKKLARQADADDVEMQKRDAHKKPKRLRSDDTPEDDDARRKPIKSIRRQVDADEEIATKGRHQKPKPNAHKQSKHQHSDDDAEPMARPSKPTKKSSRHESDDEEIAATQQVNRKTDKTKQSKTQRSNDEDTPVSRPHKSKRLAAVAAQSSDASDFDERAPRLPAAQKKNETSRRPAPETSEEDDDDEEPRHHSMRNESSAFVPETQDAHVEASEFVNTDCTSTYSLYSPSVPVRLSDPLQRTSSESVVVPLRSTQPNRSYARAPADREEEFVCSTSDEEEQPAIGEQSPVKHARQQNRNRRDRSNSRDENDDPNERPEGLRTVGPKSSNTAKPSSKPSRIVQEPIAEQSSEYSSECDSDVPAPKTPPPKETKTANTRNGRRNPTESDDKPKKTTKPSAKTKSRVQQPEAEQLESDQSEQAAAPVSPARSPTPMKAIRSKPFLKPAAKGKQTKEQTKPIKSSARLRKADNSSSDEAESARPQSRTKSAKTLARPAPAADSESEVDQQPPPTRSNGRNTTRNNRAMPPPMTTTAKKSVRTTRLGRDSTDVETSFDHRQRLAARRERQTRPSSSEDDDDEEDAPNRSTKTTCRTVNMDVDEAASDSNGEDDDTDDSAADSRCLAPGSQQQPAHRTVCHSEDLHETIPETQHQLASEQYDEEQEDTATEQDTTDMQRLYMSASSRSPSQQLQQLEQSGGGALQTQQTQQTQPRQRRSVSDGGGSQSSSDGDDNYAAGFASDAAGQASGSEGEDGVEDGADAVANQQEKSPSPAPQPPSPKVSRKPAGRTKKSRVEQSSSIADRSNQRTTRRGRQASKRAEESATATVADVPETETPERNTARKSRRTTTKAKKADTTKETEEQPSRRRTAARPRNPSPWRKGKHNPTMNSYDYRPFDRTPTQIDPSLRRSKRAPVPLKKYWVNEDQLWSPLIVPTKKHQPKRNTSKSSEAGTSANSVTAKGAPRRRLNSIQESTETSAETTGSTTGGGNGSAEVVIAAGSLANMLASSSQQPTQFLPVVQNADENYFIANRQNIQKMSKNNIDYYVYETQGLDTMGYMQLNGMAQKKRCKTTEMMEINVIDGVLTATIDDMEEQDFGPTSLIHIRKGVIYKLRNRFEKPVMVWFCKRMEPMWGEPSSSVTDSAITAPSSITTSYN